MNHTRASCKHLYKGSGRNVEYTSVSLDISTLSYMYDKVDNVNGLYGDVSMTPLYGPYKGFMEASL